MTSTAGSPKPSASARRIARAAVVMHGQPGQIGSGLARLQAVADEHDVELLQQPDGDDALAADIAIVLGGDGTVLRALTRFLGTGVPVIGVNFGRVGFLSSMARKDLETGLARVFAGEYEVVELPTLEVEHPEGTRQAVNDVVVASASLGRMIELELAVGGEELGRQPCDGIICSTPSGSTAYNLSNGGPVLVWGLEAMALTYVAAHSLRARPLVDPARCRRHRVEPHRGRRGGRSRRRAPGGDPLEGRASGRAHRAEAIVARDAPRGDLRAPLPAELRLVGWNRGRAARSFSGTDCSSSRSTTPGPSRRLGDRLPRRRRGTRRPRALPRLRASCPCRSGSRPTRPARRSRPRP